MQRFFNFNFLIIKKSVEEKPFDIKHRCYHFSKEVVSLISQTMFERIYFSIFDQLLRSATSIGANVVEGKSGSSKKDFRNFYTIALKSANETKYWICLIRDTEMAQIEKNNLNELLKEAMNFQNHCVYNYKSFKNSIIGFNF